MSISRLFANLAEKILKFMTPVQCFRERAFLRFDPVNSSVDATKISECVLRDATKLPPLKCLKNPVNTQLSVKLAWDISVLKYYTAIIDFLHPLTLF